MSPNPRVVEAGLREFVCAYQGYEELPFRLGQMVAVREGPVTVLGVVAEAASGPDDPSRPLQPRGDPGQTAVAVFEANPELRHLLRTTLTIAACGHIAGEAGLGLLPPSPPPLLAEVACATPSETRAVAADGAFLALLVASATCDDAVLTAAIRGAAAAVDDREAFLVEAGKELARLLKAEPARLTTILRGVADVR